MPLPGSPLTPAPEAGLGAGAFADVFARAGSASLGARRRVDDYVYGVSRRPRVGERILPFRRGGRGRAWAATPGRGEGAGGWAFPRRNLESPAAFESCNDSAPAVEGGETQRSLE